MKMNAVAVAMSLCAPSWTSGEAIAQEQRHPTKTHLIEDGFKVVAEGELLERTDVTCYLMPVRGFRGGGSDGCGDVRLTYGQFARLKKDAEEYVCVSFQKWNCFRSETQQ